MSADQEVICIELLGKRLQVKTTADNADDLHKAARLFDDTLNEIKRSQQANVNDKVFLMAGLKLAYELLNAEKQKELFLNTLNSKIENLQNKLEANLKA